MFHGRFKVAAVLLLMLVDVSAARSQGVVAGVLGPDAPGFLRYTYDQFRAGDCLDEGPLTLIQVVPIAELPRLLGFLYTHDSRGRCGGHVRCEFRLQNWRDGEGFATVPGAKQWIHGHQEPAPLTVFYVYLNLDQEPTVEQCDALLRGMIRLGTTYPQSAKASEQPGPAGTGGQEERTLAPRAEPDSNPAPRQDRPPAASVPSTQPARIPYHRRSAKSLDTSRPSVAEAPKRNWSPRDCKFPRPRSRGDLVHASMEDNFLAFDWRQVLNNCFADGKWSSSEHCKSAIDGCTNSERLHRHPALHKRGRPFVADIEGGWMGQPYRVANQLSLEAIQCVEVWGYIRCNKAVSLGPAFIERQVEILYRTADIHQALQNEWASWRVWAAGLASECEAQARASTRKRIDQSRSTKQAILQSAATREVSALTAKCVKGVGPDCSKLARMYDQGFQVEQSAQKASIAYQRGCESGDQSACLGFASALRTGKGCKRDAWAAYNMLGGLCRKSNGPACVLAAEMQLRGEGTAKNETQAVQTFSVFCANGVVAACARLGLSMWEGTAERADQLRGQVLLERSCRAKDPLGCTMLGVSYAQGGQHLTRDPVRAAAYYREGCELGEPTACLNLAKSYETGDGVVTSTPRALAFEQRACDAGHASACNGLADKYFHGSGAPPDKLHGLRLHERACELGEVRGCLGAGMAYRDANGMAADLGRARELFENACDGDLGEGCHAAGALFWQGEGVPTDVSRANAFFVRGCTLGHGLSCYELASSYRDGQGVPADQVRANEYLRRACELEPQTDCSSPKQAVGD
jgi:uncharacterized protein